MTLLALISWPYLRRHVLRTVVTMAGIALGVAVFLGMHAANDAVLRGFSQTVDRIAGRTELQVSAGETGFGEDVLDAVQSASTVRVAVPVIEVVADTPFEAEGSLLVLGVDMTGDRSLRDYDLEETGDTLLDDPLIFLAQPDSLIVSKEFAARHALGLGSRLPLGTSEGLRTFTVRGVVRSPDLAKAFGGNVAVMDIYAAQRMFGRGRTFDRIDIGVREGVSIAECQREIQAIVGRGFDVQPPSARGRQFESLLASYSLMVGISSAFALFIGMFIVYNACWVAVAERQTEIGTLRALGATPQQIRTIFFGESLALGFVGSAGGLLLGSAIARAIAVGIGTLLGNVYRLGQSVEAVTISPWLLAGSFAAGVATSLAAGALPARSAARLDPVQALQKTRAYRLSPRHRTLRVAGAAALAIFAALTIRSDATARPLFYAGYAAVIAAALLVTPVVTLALASTLRPLVTWLRPVEGAVAIDSLMQAPRRTAASVAALMLAVAIALAFDGMGIANTRSVQGWMEAVLNPDLFVTPSQSLDMRTARFPAAMAAELGAVEGVARVQTVRNARMTYRGAPAMVVALEMDSIAETVRLPPVAGRAPAMYRQAAAGEGLILSDTFAQLQRLRVGDVLELAAPYGTVRLPVAGVIVDYSDQQGAILIDRQIFERFWRDDSVNVFRVYTAPATDPMQVRARILERFSGQRRVFVLTNAELKRHIAGVLDQWGSLTTVQVAVAVFVAVLGIVNTVTLSISDRRRELGVLRAVGGLNGQLRQSIWMEAVGIGIVGLVLGTALGAVNLFYLLDVAQRDVTGIRLDYHFPVGTALALVPVIALASLAAAVWPAESAVRVPLVEALEYE
ncbi:MAG: FtsX-like permease family protein [Acidobacteria bacterium]|nr:FtsX-like permease family protein [Acidobacteriota bacterium]